MRILLASIAALAAAQAHAVATPANLVTNGSFEQGLTGWTTGGTFQTNSIAAIFYGAAQPYPNGAFGEAVPVDNSTSMSPDAAGSRAAYFVDDFAVNQSLTQSVYLAPGTYRVGFSAYAPSNGYNNVGEATFSGTIAGVTLANYAVSTGPRQTWQNFSGLATISTAGQYAVAFNFNTNRNPSKDVVIDRVFILADSSGGPGTVIPPVSAIPEPATWAMMIIGFGMVGGAMRRRTAARAA